MPPYPPWLIISLAGLVGAVVGSFLNVCIHRLPRGESLIAPRSRCPGCLNPIRFYDNLPVLSFFLLRGKCRSCGAAISKRYPLVETLTAILFLLLCIRYGVGWSVLVYGLLASALVVITFIDLDHRIIPDVITLPGIPLGFLAGLTVLPVGLYQSLLGAVLGGGILLAVAWLSRGGMGGGDVKLLAMIGAFVGGWMTMWTLLIGSLAGSLVGIALMLAGRKGPKDAIPFGPFLAFGALCVLLLGDRITSWYWSWFVSP